MKTGISIVTAGLAALASGCSGTARTDAPGAGGDGAATSRSTGTSAGGASTGIPAGGASASTTAASGGRGDGGGNLDATSSPSSDGPSFAQGGPGCGLDAAAFCDTFDLPSTAHGRAGDLDPLKWSGGRLVVQLPTSGSNPFPIMPAVIANCRAGLPATAFPDGDTLICDPSTSIGSPQLLVAVAAQNYGENSYRIRQPFDFADRTGTIVFDAEAFNLPLLGWISLDVTEDPIAVPSFAIRYNDEGAVIPQNAFEVQLAGACGASATTVATTGSFSVDSIHVFNDYVDTVSSPPLAPLCLPSRQGALNHFEIHVSETKIDVLATPVSTGGAPFGAAELLFSAAVAIPFTRGYVHITTHNHATLKYSPNNGLRSWAAHWDNVGFDGPVVTNWREYEIPDSLTATPGAPFGFTAPPQGSVNVGYVVADEAHGPGGVLHFSGVDLDGVTGASIAVSSWYDLSQGTASQFSLMYRLNGGIWHDRPLTSGELAMSAGPRIVEGSTPTTSGMWGAFGQMLDVPVAELVAGDNTLEFVTSNVPQSYPPAVANVDLVVATQ
jgi:hypothetical protein